VTSPSTIRRRSGCPPSLTDATIRTAEREGLARTATLALLVTYALEEMPPGWRG
jgi:hypothetical protein